jgi:dihydrodipicolinate reductase
VLALFSPQIAQSFVEVGRCLLEQLPSAREAVTQSGTGLVWAPNFSVGVNLFFQAVADTAALFAKKPEYDAWGWEIHHGAKKDSPSGTLRKLAEDMRASGYERDYVLQAARGPVGFELDWARRNREFLENLLR